MDHDWRFQGAILWKTNRGWQATPVFDYRLRFTGAPNEHPTLESEMDHAAEWFSAQWLLDCWRSGDRSWRKSMEHMGPLWHLSADWRAELVSLLAECSSLSDGCEQLDSIQAVFRQLGLGKMLAAVQPEALRRAQAELGFPWHVIDPGELQRRRAGQRSSQGAWQGVARLTDSLAPGCRAAGPKPWCWAEAVLLGRSRAAGPNPWCGNWPGSQWR